ncbi:MAG: hypothetical protein AB1768_17790 [Pseudomonadota bacterium]|jgi:hypothetical protein
MTKKNSDYTRNSRERKIIEEGRARFDGFMSASAIRQIDALMEERGFESRAQAVEYLVARSGEVLSRPSMGKQTLVLRAEGYCAADLEACLRAALPMIHQGMRIGEGAGFDGAFDYEITDSESSKKKRNGAH